MYRDKQAYQGGVVGASDITVSTLVLEDRERVRCVVMAVVGLARAQYAASQRVFETGTTGELDTRGGTIHLGVEARIVTDPTHGEVLEVTIDTIDTGHLTLQPDELVEIVGGLRTQIAAFGAPLYGNPLGTVVLYLRPQPPAASL